MTRRRRVACVLAGVLASASLAGCGGISSEAGRPPPQRPGTHSPHRTKRRRARPARATLAPTSPPRAAAPAAATHVATAELAELDRRGHLRGRPVRRHRHHVPSSTMDVLAPTAPGTRPIVLFVAGGPNPLTNQGYVMDAGFPVAVHDAVVMQPVGGRTRTRAVAGRRRSRTSPARSAWRATSGRTMAATRTAWSWSGTRSVAGRARWSPCRRKTSPRPKAPATPPRLAAAGRAGHPRRCRRPRREGSRPAGVPARLLRRQQGPAPAAVGAVRPVRARQRKHNQVPVTVVHGTGDTTVNPQ